MILLKKRTTLNLKRKTLFITRLALLIALTIIVQIGGFPQPITGPLVNALLFISTHLLGLVSGLALGTLTPAVAVIRGQLPPPLAPMIPFIVVGNSLLVTVYYMISQKMKFIIQNNKPPSKRIEIYIAMICAATIKYMLLSLAIKAVLPIIISKELPDKLVLAMTTPQLFTALIGGAIALVIFEILFRARYEFE